MQSDTLYIEQERLAFTLKLLRREHSQLIQRVKNLEKEYTKGLKEASEAAGLDEAAEIIAGLNFMMEARDYAFQKDYIRRVSSQLNFPYFARIDFQIKGTDEPMKIYIGKYSYMPKDIRYQVTDWRAPAASLFYNYVNPTKDAFYEFLIEIKYQPWKKEHRKIVGDLQLRRNLEIAQGKLLGIYDNNLRIDLLTSELSGKSGGKLEDIIKTIQSEQDVIIRSDPNKVCVVQGTAGSGKTTVAIHRMSYLFYTYPDYINEKNTLLLTTSRVLVNYIAQSLPELEIYSLVRDTLVNYLRKTLAEAGYKIESEKIHSEKFDTSGQINSHGFMRAVDDYILDRKNEILHQLKVISSGIHNAERYLERMGDRAPLELLDIMLDDFSGHLKELEADAKKGILPREGMVTDYRYIVSKLRKMTKGFDPIKEYETFLKSGYMKEVNISFDKANMSVDDVCVIYYLARKLKGVKTGEREFRHIVIDEGQDFGIFNYLIIKLLSSAGGFTIFGDLNQASGMQGEIAKWEDLEKVWDAKDVDYYNIPVSYRTTKQIIKLARGILEKFPEFTHLPEPFDRDGPEPVKAIYSNRQAMLRNVIKKIRELYKKKDFRAIGIIDMNEKLAKETSNYLKENKIKHSLINKLFSDFDSSGVYVVPIQHVKGLEFNTVFVLDFQSEVNAKSAKSLFVCVTRAINNLFIYSLGKHSPLLPEKS